MMNVLGKYMAYASNYFPKAFRTKPDTQFATKGRLASQYELLKLTGKRRKYAIRKGLI